MCAVGAFCGADKLRGDGYAEVGVEDDTKERAAARQVVGAEQIAAGWILHSAAVGELRVVGEDGADAREYGVAGVAGSVVRTGGEAVCGGAATGTSRSVGA